jgi:hemoglobin
MKPDILSREDIKLLIDSFYDKVVKNNTLGYIFNDIAKVNWEQHLPVMYAFWSSLLLNEQSYAGNPMSKHLALNKITPLTEIEFSAWLGLFHETVDDHFEGSVAKEAKSRAEQIARLMQHKIQNDG